MEKKTECTVVAADPVSNFNLSHGSCALANLLFLALSCHRMDHSWRATILLKLAVAIFKTVVGSKVVHSSDFFGVFVAGKKEYSPPEMISVDHYKAVATDVWMLGMSLYQMLQGYLPFKNDQDILKKDVQFDRKVSEGESAEHFFWRSVCVFCCCCSFTSRQIEISCFLWTITYM